MKKILCTLFCIVLVMTMIPMASGTSFASADTPDFLCFTAVGTDSNIRLDRKILAGNPGVLQNNPIKLKYSLDGGGTWEDYTWPNEVVGNLQEGYLIEITKGSSVYFRASDTNSDFSRDEFNYYNYKMQGSIAASGNIMSLVDASCNSKEIPNEDCFISLFSGCTSLTTAPNLPAVTLTDHCYENMFSGCTSLTTAPNLPATILSGSCYLNMFNGCTSLTKAPDLYAATLAGYCYDGMFNGCTSLTKAPNLPAATLSDYCYSYMFNGCTSLTKAPNLPATTLAKYCYSNMFNGCTKLTEAPALPATTLSDNCYLSMFHSCKSLMKAPELPATTLKNSCYANMFFRCTSLTDVPNLPATTLAEFCCSSMFNGCTSLMKAPELPATTLTDNCYKNMFTGCTSLDYIAVDFTEWGPSTATQNWVGNVASTGAFYCPEELPEIVSTSNIPSGWLINPPKVTFDVQGHGTAPRPIAVSSGSNISEPDAPTAQGFRFVGWFKEASCTNAWNFSYDVVNGDITLYAKWEENAPVFPGGAILMPISYNIIFDSNGGSGVLKEQKITQGNDFILPENSFTAPSGYTFECWSINEKEYKPGDKVKVDSDITVKAVWTAVKSDGYSSFYSDTEGYIFKATTKKSKLNGKTAIKVSWTNLTGADGYEVFRSTKRFSGFGKKPYFSTTKTTYTNNKELVKGKTYYYKVRAYKLVAGEKVYSKWSTKAWRKVK